MFDVEYTVYIFFLNYAIFGLLFFFFIINWYLCSTYQSRVIYIISYGLPLLLITSSQIAQLFGSFLLNNHWFFLIITIIIIFKLCFKCSITNTNRPMWSFITYKIRFANRISSFHQAFLFQSFWILFFK